MRCGKSAGAAGISKKRRSPSNYACPKREKSGVFDHEQAFDCAMLFY